jgi:hypothetical protein
MTSTTRRRLIRLRNNTGPLMVAFGIFCIALASLAARGRL